MPIPVAEPIVPARRAHQRNAAAAGQAGQAGQPAQRRGRGRPRLNANAEERPARRGRGRPRRGEVRPEPVDQNPDQSEPEEPPVIDDFVEPEVQPQPEALDVGVVEDIAEPVIEEPAAPVIVEPRRNANDGAVPERPARRGRGRPRRNQPVIAEPGAEHPVRGRGRPPRNQPRPEPVIEVPAELEQNQPEPEDVDVQLFEGLDVLVFEDIAEPLIEELAVPAIDGPHHVNDVAVAREVVVADHDEPVVPKKKRKTRRGGPSKYYISQSVICNVLFSTGPFILNTF